jgi:tripartite-type tricarboxylate transporter receptor subunit TctC
LQVLPRSATAQNYPSRPINLVITFPAGGAPDVIGRLVGQWLSERLGQPFVVENRQGFGGNIATEYVVRAKPDGYTILMPVSTNAVNATLYPNLSFNFIRDIVPVAGIAKTPFVVLVTPSFPAKTISEFVTYAKANPGKINLASPGNGSSNHIFAELFKMMTGADFVHVPYRASYLPDLLTGQVQVVFGPTAGMLDLVRSGKLRALAVTPLNRLSLLPDVPALSEAVPSYEAFGWYGLGVPKNTPADIVNKLSNAMNDALADRGSQARLIELGVEPMPLTPAEFTKFIADETDKWAKVIRTANIKTE